MLSSEKQAICWGISFLLIITLGGAETNGNDITMAIPAFQPDNYVASLGAKEIKGVLGSEHLEILGIKVWDDRLTTVISKLGYAKEFKIDDDVHSPLCICYVPSQKEIDQIILFEAGFLGNYKYITSITVGLKKYIREHIEYCASSEILNKTITTRSGIGLHADSATLLKNINHSPSLEGPNLIAFAFHSTEPMTKEEVEQYTKIFGKVPDPYFDVTSRLLAYFIGSKMQWFSVRKVHSY